MDRTWIRGFANLWGVGYRLIDGPLHQEEALRWARRAPERSAQPGVRHVAELLRYEPGRRRMATIPAHISSANDHKRAETIMSSGTCAVRGAAVS
jgi:hypothetical protein